MAEPWATCLPAIEKGDSEISLLGCETVVSPESSGLGQDPSPGPKFQQSRLRGPLLKEEPPVPFTQQLSRGCARQYLEVERKE